MTHGGRRALWTAVGIAAVAVVGVAAGEASGWPFLRSPLQRAMSRALAVPVVLEGNFRVRFLFRPHLVIQHLNVAPASGIAVPHLVDGQGVDLAWRWGDVWRWRQGAPLRVQRLAVDAMDANLVRTADGRASWQLGPPSQPKPAADDESGALASLPHFGTLLVGKGRVTFDDKMLDTAMVVTLSGREGDNPQPGVSAGYTAQAEGRYRALPLKLSLRTGAALPVFQDEEAGQPAPSVGVHVEGQAGAVGVFFDGHAAALLGARQIDGDLRLRGPSLELAGLPLGVTLPQTPPFDLAGHLSYGPGVWHLRADRAAIGNSLMAGDFRFDQRSSPPRLSGRLTGPRLSLADLGPSIGAPTAGAPRTAPAGRVLPQKQFDLPSLRAMDADVQVAIDEFDLNTPALAPLKSLQTQLLLQGGVLQLKDLKTAVAGGRISGFTQLDARGQPARWAADLHFAGVDVAGWIRGVNKPADKAAPVPAAKELRQRREVARNGGDQPARAYLTGELTGDLNVTGQGRSTAEILGTLDGTARFALKDGTVSHLLTELAGLDIAQSLGVFVRGDRPLPLRCARLDLVTHHGVVQPRQAVIDNSDSTVHIGGRIDLRDETIALKADAKPKDFSLLALRAPLTVGGTLSAPKVGIEARRLAGRVLGAVALGVVAAPAAALLPFVDTGSPESGDPCAEPPPAKVAAK